MIHARHEKLAIAAALVALVLAASPGSAQDTSAQLVLRGGKVISVASVALKGDHVHVTCADGRMQAYSTADVDLEASGLQSPAVESAPPTPEVRRGSLASAIATGTAGSRVAITDEDVQRVSGAYQPPATADGEDGEGVEAAEKSSEISLLIVGFNSAVSDGTATLTGRLVNNSARRVSGIQLEGLAVNAEGATVGRGGTTIGDMLDPQQAVEFSFAFAVDGQVQDVRVRASAAMADFQFEELEAPDGQPTGEPGAEPGQPPIE